MPLHKFKVGDIVALNPAVSRNVPGGVLKSPNSFQARGSLNIASRALTNRTSALRLKASFLKLRQNAGRIQ
jgi:hypothetical protein